MQQMEPKEISLRLTHIYEIRGRIRLLTGLHIGGQDSVMHIGGVDLPVIRNPQTGEPYIPGSSIKGKMRSLLEQTTGLMGKTGGGVLTFKKLQEAKNGFSEDQKKTATGILKLFGSGGSDSDESDIGPTRLSFADAFLNRKWVEEQERAKKPLTEVKSENTINRIKGTAEHPRQIERVVAGAEFDFRITAKSLMEGDEDLFTDLLIRGLKLLEMDALGGHSSRGYGRIALEIEEDCAIGGKKIKDIYNNIKVFG